MAKFFKLDFDGGTATINIDEISSVEGDAADSMVVIMHNRDKFYPTGESYLRLKPFLNEPSR